MTYIVFLLCSWLELRLKSRYQMMDSWKEKVITTLRRCLTFPRGLCGCEVSILRSFPLLFNSGIQILEQVLRISHAIVVRGIGIFIVKITVILSR